ncbi:MAG: GntR family transcriptional regulator [Firmicutes bacterium]|nr:GntR family transcriptional regulator [Bacillota bacterium]
MFVIDSLSRTPVYEQIIQQTENFILTGVIEPDSPMPSVRSVAAETSSNPNTIQKAYTQMLGRGILYAVPGKGSFVSREARDKLREECAASLSKVENLAAGFARAGIEKNLVIEAVERGYKSVNQ